MVASVETMLEKWRHHQGKEIDVCPDFKLRTSDMISRTAFGSSYLEGRKISLRSLISRNVYNIRFCGILYVASLLSIAYV